MTGSKFGTMEIGDHALPITHVTLEKSGVTFTAQIPAEWTKLGDLDYPVEIIGADGSLIWRTKEHFFSEYGDSLIIGPCVITWSLLVNLTAKMAVVV